MAKITSWQRWLLVRIALVAVFLGIDFSIIGGTTSLPESSSPPEIEQLTQSGKEFKWVRDHWEYAHHDGSIFFYYPEGLKGFIELPRGYGFGFNGDGLPSEYYETYRDFFQAFGFDPKILQSMVASADRGNVSICEGRATGTYCCNFYNRNDLRVYCSTERLSN